MTYKITDKYQITILIILIINGKKNYLKHPFFASHYGRRNYNHTLKEELIAVFIC